MVRIAGLHIGRAAADPTPVPKKELGASGTINLNGWLSELEYNTDLTGEKGVDTFERMRSSDGAVSEALGHFVSPVRNATWDIEPASEDPLDLEVAEAVRRAFFTWPAQPFAEYADQALDYLVFGRGVFETVWQVVEDELVVPATDGDPTVVPTRQFLTFRRFAQRLPKTIVRWLVEDGDLVGVEQQTWKNGSYVTVTIPADRLVVFVNQRRGDDFTGRSLLRSAHKHWVMKELVEKIEIVALERLGVGILVGYPSQANNDAATLARMEEILENVRAGARTYIVSPGPKGQSSAASQDGFSFEILTPGGQPPDFKGAKEYHRGEIKGSMLVRFAELGHGQTGARATSDSQSEVWYDALHAVAKHFAEVNDDPIRQFVDANYTAVGGYPKLIARDIESKSLLEFADANAKLVSSGAIEPDRSYRRFVREGVGAPDEDDPDASDAALAPADPLHDPDADPMPEELMRQEETRRQAAQQQAQQAAQLRIEDELVKVRATVQKIADTPAPPPQPVTVTIAEGAIVAPAPPPIEVNVAAPAPAPPANVEVRFEETRARTQRIVRDKGGEIVAVEDVADDSGTARSRRVVRGKGGDIERIEDE